MDIEALKVHRSGPTDTAYIAADGKLRLFGELPTRYTPEALLNRVNKFITDNPPLFDYTTYALRQTRLVQDTAEWGTINRRQARAYCATIGVPRPVFPGDHPDPKVQDALDLLEEEAGAGA